MKNLTFIFCLLIIFSLFSCRGPLAKPGSNNKPGEEHIKEAISERDEIKIDPAEGGITISELFSNKEKYSGKIVRVRGKVMKVNTSIMGKNWIHLQDGTSHGDSYDLTITSELIPETGSIITVEGKIVLDMDFGSGYSYKVIMEHGKVVY